MDALILVKVTLNDEFYGLYTFEAYRELRLQFSTGDFHMHKNTLITVPINSEYTAIDDNTFEFYVINERSK